MEDTVTIKKKTLQKLLKNFYEVCSLCDECDIYEHEKLDDYMEEMKEWVETTFDREINKSSY